MYVILLLTTVYLFDVDDHVSPQHPIRRSSYQCLSFYSPPHSFAIYTSSLCCLFTAFLWTRLSLIFLENDNFAKPSFLIMCSRNISYLVLILSLCVLFFSFSLKRCHRLHDSTVVFTAVFYRTTYLLHEVSSLSVRTLSRIHCHGKWSILHSSLTLILFPKSFSCFLILAF